MARARAFSIPHSARSAECAINRRVRRWLAAEMRHLQRAIAVQAQACQADRYRKHFGSFGHVCMLIFHGLAGDQSLRQSYAAFALCRSLVDLAGLAAAGDDALAISFSQFAASSTSRPAALLTGLIPGLVARVRRLSTPDSQFIPPDLRIIDSTFLRISMKLARWVPHVTRSKRKSGVRVQVEYQPALDLPEYVLMTTAAHDCDGFDQLILNDPERLAALRGQTLAMDMGYYSHRRMAQLLLADVHWIVRRRSQANFEVKEDLPVQQLLPGMTFRITVLSEQRISLGSANNRAGKVLRGVRRIRAKVEPLPKAVRLGAHAHEYELLTDRWDLSAEEVVQMYLWRWQIELFFGWLKSHVRLPRLLGYSENAVELTVALAIIVHLLTILATHALGYTRRSPNVLRKLAWAYAQLSPDAVAPVAVPEQLTLQSLGPVRAPS